MLGTCESTGGTSPFRAACCNRCIRRTNDILRLVFAAVFLAVVITSSLITRNDWVALEKSISDIVGVLTPTQSNLVYLVYGIAILALPFVDPDRADRRQAVASCSAPTRRPG